MPEKHFFRFNTVFILVIFFALFFAGVFSKTALAGTAVLNWNANSESDLAGYKIYYDTASHSGTCPSGYANSQSVGKVTTYTFSSLPEGHQYYFQLTALDTSNNESACSANPGEVNKIIYNLADFDTNRTVNLFDYNTLLTNYGNTSCGNQADANKDCKVDLFDYNQVLTDYGKTF